MDIRDLPTLPFRSETSDEIFAALVEQLFRDLPGWTSDLRAIGNLAALSTNATSATSITNDTSGNKTINVGPGKGFMRAAPVLVAHTSAIFMETQVVSYDFGSGDLTFMPTRAVGDVGPYDDWAVSLMAPPANIGKQAIFFDASCWKARATDGASITEFETPTNKVNYRTLSFDKNTPQFAQLRLYLSNSWDGGTVSFRPIWSHATNDATFNKVRWQMQAMAMGNGDSLDTAFGTPQYVDDVGGAGGAQLTGDESAAITIPSAAKGKRVVFEVGRVADDVANDTLDELARLEGVVIYITLSQGNDA